jgi:phosphatidate cytidylyltransferase
MMPASPMPAWATSPTFALFAGILAVLAAASLVGFALERRYAAAEPQPVIENLNARIKAWWVMVAVLAAAFALGAGGVIALFALASFAALREFITLTPTRQGDHYALAASFFVVLPLQYYLIWADWYGLYSIFVPVYVFLLLPIVVAVRGDTGNFLERIAEIQWGLMIAIFCLSHVPALATLDFDGYDAQSLLLIAFLLIVAQASDVLQYVWGKLFGRRKVAPRLSPSKTWEGLVGGVASATAIGAGLWWITPFSPLEAGLMALTIGVMGFFGGLVMSAIKRDRGVKDWGSMIAGHGGMLDRLDSVAFAAPVFFHLTRYWWTV